MLLYAIGWYDECDSMILYAIIWDFNAIAMKFQCYAMLCCKIYTRIDCSYVATSPENPILMRL